MDKFKMLYDKWIATKDDDISGIIQIKEFIRNMNNINKQAVILYKLEYVFIDKASK
jgi:hypothetical protein